MRLSPLILFILMLVKVSSASASAEDTIPLMQRNYEHLSEGVNFITVPYLNSALQYYSPFHSFSSVQASWENEYQSRPLIGEKGQGWNGFNVSADSYLRLSPKSSIWGKALYSNGIRRNVQWNESSDYDLLYPYIAADTIGGDMKTETYFFRGGYAALCGRWTFGGEFSYRALQEFRDIDPRPDNKVADIYGKAGISYRLNIPYSLAVSIEGHKYKQSGNIQYYNEKGVSKTYHLIGLGSSYTRFDGTRTSVKYEGYAYGAGINLLPVDKDGGWGYALNYLHSYYEKMLPNVDQISLNYLNIDDIRSELSWSITSPHYYAAIKADAVYSIRNGSENIYGDAVNNIYPLISSTTPFRGDSICFSLSGCYERVETEKWRWGILPSIGYFSINQEYSLPVKKMYYSLMDFSLSLTSTLKWNKDILYIALDGIYSKQMDALLNVTGKSACPYAYTILQQDFDMQSSDKGGYGIHIIWTKSFNKILAHLGTDLEQTIYGGHKRRNHIRVNIGISF